MSAKYIIQKELEEIKKNASCFIIWNKEKPLEEYVMIFPEEYKEELTFEDYKKFKPVFQSPSIVEKI